jgi:hypothetical protein
MKTVSYTGLLAHVQSSVEAALEASSGASVYVIIDSLHVRPLFQPGTDLFPQ